MGPVRLFMGHPGPDSTYASPGPPKMKTKIKNVHQITSIFYILVSFGVILRRLWGLEAYIYIYI